MCCRLWGRIGIHMRVSEKKRKNTIVLVTLSALLAVCFVLSVMIGRYEISMKELWLVLISRVVPVEQSWSQLTDNIVMQVRIPRIIVAVLVGAALSVSGTAYQCIFRNPMAAPDVLGASTGAGFGAALAILLGRGSVEVTLWAFLASIVCVLLAVFSARVSRGNRVLSLVLAGIMIGSLFQAATSYLKLIADPHNTLPEITYWLMGSLSGVRPEELGYVWIPMLAGFVPIYILRWKMNLLTMEDAEAKTMGVNTKRVRVTVILCSTLLTASAVSVSGIIGWVGLVIPHIGRRLVGSDCRALVPASALLGGSFLLLVDDLARNLYTTELPLGVLTAVIGAPFFIYLLGRKGEW